MQTIRRIAALGVLAALLPRAWAGAWPGFRGDGTAAAPALPAKLPDTRPAWTVKLSGKCSAGLAVAEGVVVLADHAEGKYDAYRCLDASTGAERWARRFDNGREMDYGAAPRATPLIHRGKVYVLSAFGELYCLDLRTGKTVWEKKYADAYGVKAPPRWGFCASPLIAGGKLIVHPGGTGGLVALNPDNGRQVWSCPRTEPNYSSFIAGTFGGVRQVVGFDNASLGGWDLASGRRLWEVPVSGDNGYIVPTPVQVGDKLLVANNAGGARLFAFDKGGKIVKEPVATSEAPAPEVCTPTAGGNLILSAANGLTALSARDLALLYSNEDEPALTGECPLVVAGNRALAVTASGTALFFTFDARGIKITSKVKLCGDTQAHPAVADDTLYVRDDKKLYAFRLRGKQPLRGGGRDETCANGRGWVRPPTPAREPARRSPPNRTAYPHIKETAGYPNPRPAGTPGDGVMPLRTQASQWVSIRRAVLLGVFFACAGAAGLEKGAKGRSVLTLRGHTENVSSVAFSPDGKRVASGSGDGTLKVWDSASGKELRTLRGRGKGVTALAFSKDGHCIVSGNWDGTLKVWDSAGGKELLTLRGHRENVTSVAFSPDGHRIVSGSGDDTLKVWDARSGRELLSLDHGNEYDVTAVAFSPDGKRIVSGDGENALKVWDSDGGEELLTLFGHDAGVTSVAFSPDGKRVVSGSLDDTLKVWDLPSGKELLTLHGHSDDVTCVGFSPDGKRVVSGSEDGTVKVWDSHGGKELFTLRGHSGAVTSVAFSPDGRRVVSGGGDVVKVWEVAR